MATVPWLGPGVIKVPPQFGDGQLPTAPPDTPTLNPDGSLGPPLGQTPLTPPGGATDTPLGDVPVDGDPSTTEGLSLGDALTWSTGNPLADAAAGGLAGYAASQSAPPGQRPYYAAAGAVAAGALGVLGIIGVVGTALVLGRRGR